jgi:hypothetical protein
MTRLCCPHCRLRFTPPRRRTSPLAPNAATRPSRSPAWSARSAFVSSDRRTSPTSCPTQPPAQSPSPTRKRDPDRPALSASSRPKPGASFDAHDSVDNIGYTTSTRRREHFERAAARARAHLTDPNARRRNEDQLQPPDWLGPSIRPLAYSSAKRPPSEPRTPAHDEAGLTGGKPSDVPLAKLKPWRLTNRCS